MTGRADVVVIGAGSAGAVLAARLSEDPSRHVVLLEAGPDLEAAGIPSVITGPSFVAAMASEHRTWPRLQATRHSSQPARPYVRGRGVGGSSAINAMVALPGEPGDYDEWERTWGCAGWGWRHVEATFARLPIPLHVAAEHERGPISRALVAADPAAEWALLTRTADGRRASVDDVYLHPARGRSNLEVRGGSLVDRVILDGRRTVGVRLADGTELAAAAVVVSAGAIHSPAILLRSGVQRSGVGEGLHDHPSFPITLRMREPSTPVPAMLNVASLLRGTHDVTNDLQVLAVDLPTDDSSLGVLMGALMRVRSRGTVRLATTDPADDPVVQFGMLSDERDLDPMRAAVSMVERIARSAAVAAVAEVLPYDATDEGVRALLGDYVHAAGTCRMGARDDEGAVVDEHCRVIGYEGLLVCDASVMPALPRANTHLPTVMIAERVASFVSAAG